MELFFFLQAAPQAAPATPPTGSPGMWQFLPFVAIFVVMYFLMIRPQRKQAKERETMIAALKKNDHVVTNSGIYGIVKQAGATEPDVTLCIDERKDVCVRVAKSSIAALVKPSGGEPEAKAEDKKS